MPHFTLITDFIGVSFRENPYFMRFADRRVQNQCAAE